MAKAPAQVPPRCHLLPVSRSPPKWGALGALSAPTRPQLYTAPAPEDPSPSPRLRGAEQHRTPHVPPKGNPPGGRGVTGGRGHLCSGFCPTPAPGAEERPQELPSALGTPPLRSRVSKGNAAYAMSDACPSRPHQLRHPPPAPRHHRGARCRREPGSLAARRAPGTWLSAVTCAAEPLPAGQSTPRHGPRGWRRTRGASAAPLLPPPSQGRALTPGRARRGWRAANRRLQPPTDPGSRDRLFAPASPLGRGRLGRCRCHRGCGCTRRSQGSFPTKTVL